MSRRDMQGTGIPLTLVEFGDTVLPGDVLTDATERPQNGVRTQETDPKSGVVYGSGTTQVHTFASATHAGTVKGSISESVWVDSNQKRYIPAKDDEVVGIILERHPLEFVVDIGAPLPAKLDALAFEGATKRNKPNLQINSIIFCRVVLANRDMAPELSCVNAQGKAMDFGPLTGGLVVRTSLGTARRLLSDTSPVLVELGVSLAFETAIGVNGRVWIRTDNTASTVIVANAIEKSEHLSPEQVRQLVQSVVARIRNSAGGATG